MRCQLWHPSLQRPLPPPARTHTTTSAITITTATHCYFHVLLFIFFFLPTGGAAGASYGDGPDINASAPLAFSTEDVGGAPMSVASVQITEHLTAPYFLAPEQLASLMDFIAEPPAATPRLLLVTGTIKSGKTQLVMNVLPRLIAAQAAAARARARLPVVFRLTFIQGATAESAASLLVANLLAFAFQVGSPLSLPPAPGGLHVVVFVVEALARALWARGRVLWVLLDELGAPLVASTPAGASHFVETLKAMLSASCCMARFAVTGSGMLTLLEAFRSASVHGFLLPVALVPISLGREPPPPVAAAMARRILLAYSTPWSAHADAVEFLTPERVLGVVARDAHCGITSSRPALVAYLMTLLGPLREGSPAEALATATMFMLGKLRDESERDAAVALGRLPHGARLLLRALAEESHPLPLEQLREHFKNESFLGLIVEMLCECGSPARLMPPYAALLRSWVGKSGRLAVQCTGDLVHLTPATRKALVLFAEKRARIGEDVQRAVSKVVLAAFAANGVGHVPPSTAFVRAPETVDELGGIPAVLCLLRALDKDGVAAPARAALQKMQRDPRPDVKQAYMSTAGFLLLTWIRHYDSHVWFPLSDLPQSGLTGAVIEEVVGAVVEHLVAAFPDTFAVEVVEGMGMLNLLVEAKGPA